MLPDLASLLAGYALYAKQNGLPPDRDEARLAEALAEARALATGDEAAEPAALFHALTRRPRIFGRAHGRMTLHLAVEQARAVGLALTCDLVVLELMRGRILREALPFAEVRAWFSGQLAPLPRRPWPPR
ncbi:MAG: hypothetical protein QM820_60465 [Minicystis sp.]